MKNRALTASPIAAGLAAAALASDVLVTVDRREVTGEIRYGPRRPQGVPAVDKFTDLGVTENFMLEAKASMPLFAEDCRMSNYRRDGRARAAAYRGTAVARG